VQSISRRLVNAGHKVLVYGFSSKQLNFEDRGVRVRIDDIQAPPKATRDTFTERLNRFATDERVDVIEAPEYGGLLGIGITACPVVIRMHQSASAIALANRRIPRLPVYLAERQSVSLYRNWIGVSKFVLNLNKKLFVTNPTREAVIYNFPAIERSADAAPALPFRYVLFVGKVVRNKGVVELARAMARIMARDQSLHLVFAGAVGSYRGEGMDMTLAKHLGLGSDRVHYLGRQPHSHTTELMKGALLLALPSYIEAFSLVPLESMAVGTPVVFTRRASGPETIVDGVDGLLVDPKSIEEIETAICRLLYDHQLRASIAAEGLRTIAEKFTPDQCLDRTLSFYRDVG
jgi:L-malate glycosyltransferase